ncbi:DUF2254 domain-containing protein [Rhodococcus opacus]|nr:DUF2254 domain-containing protein [Rhodococcus opacus]
MPEVTVRAALIVGHEHTFEQDPLPAFRLLVDIALRALSPAVDDPATAVQALDELADLLARVADISLAPSRFADADGTARVLVHRPDWGTFVHVALGDAPPDRRDLLADRLSWVEEELATRFPRLSSDGTAADRTTDLIGQRWCGGFRGRVGGPRSIAVIVRGTRCGRSPSSGCR